MKRMILLVTLMPLISAPVFAQSEEADPHDKDREAIIASIATYADAFNAGDVKTLAHCWSSDGQWRNQETGEQVSGRESIEKQFGAMFAESETRRIDVSVQSIHFVSDEVAVEEGVATVIGRSGASDSRYTAIHVRTNEGWKLDNVWETVVPTAAATPRNYPQLRELEWMVGHWVDVSDESVIETNCSWTKNRNFLTRTFKVVIDGQIDLEGTQVIGWDPRRGSIRSWVFDSDGGFGEGSWTRNGNRWKVKVKQTLADGSSASSVNFFTYVDENNFTWQSQGRKLDGQVTPDIAEVNVTRQPTE